MSSLPDGGFAVVWAEENGQDGSSQGVYRKVYDADGQVVADGQVITGGPGDDSLLGGLGDDVLTGGGGADRLDGGLGSDTYQFGVDGNVDTIVNDDNDAGSIDKLVFDASMESTDIWFQNQNNDLVVSILGTQDQVVVDDWFVDQSHQLDQIVSGDGKLLNTADVSQLVSAMAAFQPNDGTDATGVLPDQLPADVQVAVESAWQTSTP